MNCPKCLSSDIYRKSPLSLDIYCAKCHFCWKARQVLRPFLTQEVYRKTPPKGKHKVSVWCCPLNPKRYSFQITYGSGIMRFEEFTSSPYLSGDYPTAEEALKSGVDKVYE